MVSLCGAKVLVRRGSGGVSGGQVWRMPSRPGRPGLRAGALVTLALGLAACANNVANEPIKPTAGEDLSVAVVVQTQPVGASCTLDRDGRRLGVVARTPGSIPVAPGRRDVVVTCRLNGHAPETVRLTPTTSGGVTGNLLPEDLALGVRRLDRLTYPRNVSILMTPLRFDSETDRRRHFIFKRRELNARADDAAAAVEAMCRAAQIGCGRARSDLARAVAARRAQIGSEERAARVQPDR